MSNGLPGWSAVRRSVRPFGLVVLGMSAVCVAWPILAVIYPPFVDYPQHLATVAAIHGEGRLSEVFVLDLGRSQYLAFYYASHLAAYVFGVEGGTKLVLAVSLALLPLSVAAFFAAHRRPPVLGALSGAVGLHTYVFWGFINYAAAIWVSFAALACLACLVRHPSVRWGIAYAVLTLLCFYSHAQMYAWLAIASVVQVAAMAPAWGSSRTLRGLGTAAVAALPSMAALGWWLSQSSFLTLGEVPVRATGAVPAAGGGARYVPVADTVRGALGQSWDVYRDGAGVDLAVAFLVAVALCAALRGTQWASRIAPSKESWAPEAVLALTVAAYLFAPFSFKLVEPISHRFLPVALALLPGLGPVTADQRATRLWLGAVGLALSLYGLDLHLDRFRAASDEVGELDQALERARPGQRLLGLIYDRDSTVVALPIHLHSHQYYQARRGGLAAWSFVEMPKSPIRYRPKAAPSAFPARFEWTPQRFAWGRWGNDFDYFLVRTAPGRPVPSIAPRDVSESPRMVFRGDRWTLFAR